MHDINCNYHLLIQTILSVGQGFLAFCATVLQNSAVEPSE